jgi:Ca2+-binding EF-hand superfamily protein
MRESFEVLDSNNNGNINAAAVAEMLSQFGLEPSPVTLATFFPGQGPPTLNLARYLDILAGPLAELSAPEELRAAFEAFDLDDSGQIDVGALRDALVHSAGAPGGGSGGGGARLSRGEIDGILGEFSSRRAFGAKGLNAAKNKGDVFRYRDFMANVSGGSGSVVPGAEGEAHVA